MVNLHVQHASMQRTDTFLQFASDLAAIARRNAHLIGLTELTGREREARGMLAGRGYGLIRPRRAGDVGIAYRLDFWGKPAVFGADPAVPGIPGEHAPRTNLWATWDHPRIGEVTFNVDHYVTGASRSSTRRRQVMHQADVVIRRVKAAGKGRGVAFWTADTNVDEDDPAGRAFYAALRAGGLEPITDALDLEPKPTRGRRTIDVVGGYDPDRRVTARGMRVWPRDHSDHRAVSGFYEIRPLS